MADNKDEDRSNRGVRFADTPATAAVATPAPRISAQPRGSTDGGRPSASGAHSASRTDDAVLRARAREALAQLMEGHARFQQGALVRCRADPATLADLRDAPCDPVAVVLACSDARVPPELIFDAGLGDLHVVRVAGPVLAAPPPAPSSSATGSSSGRPPADIVAASVVEPLRSGGTRLVLVLGHTRCPAVARAIEAWSAARAGAQNSGGHHGPPSFGRRSPSPGVDAARAAAACPPPGTTAFAAAAAAVATRKPPPPAERGFSGWLRRTFSRSGSLNSGGQRGKAGADRGGGGAGGAATPPADGPPPLYRASANPLAALTDGLAAAVDAVARGVRGHHHHGTPGGGGGGGGRGSDSDDGGAGAAAARAARASRLRTQDSLAIAHARLDKAKKDAALPRTGSLTGGSKTGRGGGEAAAAAPAPAAAVEAAAGAADPPSSSACVDDVVAAHVKLTVSAVLRAVARALPPAAAREVLVAGAVYDLDAGTARLLRVGWTSGRDFYYDRLESAD